MIDRDYAGSGIYRENIMDHYKNPRNNGIIENPTIKFFDTNPVCGDEVTIYLEINGNTIKNIKFTGHGCAISQSAISILSEEVKNKKIEDVLKLDKEYIKKLLGIELSAIRIKCATLGLNALKKGLIKNVRN